MILLYISIVLAVLGIGGGVLTLVFRLPIIDSLLDVAFENSPLGRVEVQELNRAETERDTQAEPVPHSEKRLV